VNSRSSMLYAIVRDAMARHGSSAVIPILPDSVDAPPLLGDDGVNIFRTVTITFDPEQYPELTGDSCSEPI